MLSTEKKSALGVYGVLVAAALALTGCAHHTATRENLASARTSVESARRSGAPADAPVEFRRAEDKLNAAEAAARDERYGEAKRLAEEARIDADLAEQNAQSARARRAVAELQQSISVLRQQMGLPPES